MNSPTITDKPPIPVGLCQCGCGQKTNIAKRTNRPFGMVRGQPRRFLQGHFVKGDPLVNYKTHRGRLKHVLVAEKALGRPLRKPEEVHHIDADRSNSRNDNLVICPTRAYHMLLHARKRVRDAGGDPNTQKVCKKCLRVLNRDRFHRLKSNASSGCHAFCKECTKKDHEAWKALYDF